MKLKEIDILSIYIERMSISFNAVFLTKQYALSFHIAC